MKIAICDDEAVQIKYIENLVKVWSKEKADTCCIEGIYSAEEFLFKYEDGNPFDLIILDIQMKDINGIELAKKIRFTDKNVKIIFLTGVKDYVFDGYEVGAARYILKPLKENEFFQLLDAIMEEITNNPDNYFVFSYLGENMKLSYKDIIKIEVQGHYINMLTVDKEYTWKESLLKMVEKLKDKGFVLANRSALVNVMHIDRITKEECILCKNIIVPISKRSYKEVNQAFIAYYM
ncbi:response regulator transcription factor [Clostridium sp. 19966]|uniref:LytR/AlgR family response regulator transcription factor n=1 Tax=Clostridium sp. 19966 TaxID=2768166 RepID=UPI0028DFD4C1|nr:LytTR family DNA-binding domain-containing protein [Clostridium sp. 19966]MDT8715359.1 response regulator transcription factor [Clostridium sp. 19966]